MKKMYLLFAVAITACVSLTSCEKNRTVEFYSWFKCSPEQLHYAIPVVEYSDYTGALLTDTLTEADFQMVSSPQDVVGGSDAPFLRCDLVNRVYLEYGIRNQLIVRYLPKEVDYAGESICLGHAVSDSLVVSQGKNESRSLLTNNKIDLSTNSGQNYLDELFFHRDTMSCSVDENGKVTLFNSMRRQ